MYPRLHEPSIAKKIAEGDLCPISLDEMVDINPSFVPRAIKVLPLQDRDQNTPIADKGKGKEKAQKGILSFFSEYSKRTN